MRFILILLILVSGVARSDLSPKGDNAIISLSLASLACAAVQKVNPEAVDIVDEAYMDHSIKLYQFYHDFPYDIAKRNQIGLYKILTDEPAIKAQSLRSVAGAKNYLSQYLRKTDATECSQIREYSNKILSVYGKKL